jgi:hypothetical protein
MTTAKTALHTSNECDMYAHVSPYDMTGDWEWISEYFVLCTSSSAHLHIDGRLMMKNQSCAFRLFCAVAGIPDTFTGQPNFNIAKPADNCWVSPFNSLFIIHALKRDNRFSW